VSRRLTDGSQLGPNWTRRNSLGLKLGLGLSLPLGLRVRFALNTKNLSTSKIFACDGRTDNTDHYYSQLADRLMLMTEWMKHVGRQTWAKKWLRQIIRVANSSDRRRNWITATRCILAQWNMISCPAEARWVENNMAGNTVIPGGDANVAVSEQSGWTVDAKRRVVISIAWAAHYCGRWPRRLSANLSRGLIRCCDPSEKKLNLLDPLKLCATTKCCTILHCVRKKVNHRQYLTEMSIINAS